MFDITWGFDFDDVLCLTPRLPAAVGAIKKLLIQAPMLHDRGLMKFAPELGLVQFAREVQEQGARLVIVTGRRTWAARSTERWLEELGLRFDAVVHKPPFDRRSTPQFKVDTLRALHCRAFVDDDPKNVDAINRGGTCIAFLWDPRRPREVIRALRQMHERLRETFCQP